MTERYKFTDRKLESLKAKDSRYEAFDSEVTGLGIRVTPKGSASFFLVARYGGARNPTRRFIGAYSPHLKDCLREARAKALIWRAKLRQGIDPAAEENAAKEANLVSARNTFEMVAEDYIRQHLSKIRKGKVFEADIRRRFIARWKDRPFTSITQQDVAAAIREITADNYFAQAHNSFALIRGLFNWALGVGAYGIKASPCQHIKPNSLIGKRIFRDRTLSSDEILAFWRASYKLPHPYGTQLRMLALTIQRKSEVCEAAWPEFDLDKKLWTIPAARMKAKSAHEVPLSDMAVDILRSIPKLTFPRGDFVFSTTFGKKPTQILMPIKHKLDALMLEELRAVAKERGNDPAKVTLEPFVLHDIRRTGRTGLSALGTPDMISELVIAHSKDTLHTVYDLHTYQDEKRKALDLWAGKLRDIIAPPPANVTKLLAKA